MKSLYKRIAVCLLSACCILQSAWPTYALIQSVTFDNNITGETVGATSTLIHYSVDSITPEIDIHIYHLKDITDIPGPSNDVGPLNQTSIGIGPHAVLWDGFWPVGGVLGRQDGNLFKIVVEDVTTGQKYAALSYLSITSVDIHSVSVTPSFDANQNPALPYVITYALAKDSKVTIRITDTLGSVVRTLVSNAPQFGESVKPTNTVLWNGLNDAGKPVPLGTYTVLIDAKDPFTTDTAIQRTGTATIQSLANLDSDAKTTFETNAIVYPNPVREGNAATACGTPACFQFLAVRNNATITLKIYTITGTLVRDEKFANLTTGNVVSFNWDATNQGGKALGRGLYYFVAREEDEAGTLQTVKKMAVIK